LYAAGGWIPELLQLAGAESLFAGPGELSATFSMDDLRECRADVILFAICGLPLHGAVNEARKALRDWPKLPITATASLVAADAQKLFSRPGPFLVDSLETLVEILHPEAQSYGHYGISWCALGPEGGPSSVTPRFRLASQNKG